MLTGRVVAERVVLVGEITSPVVGDRGSAPEPDGTLDVAAQAEQPGHDVEELRAVVAALAASVAQRQEVVRGLGHDAVVHLDRQPAQRSVGCRVHDVQKTSVARSVKTVTTQRKINNPKDSDSIFKIHIFVFLNPNPRAVHPGFFNDILIRILNLMAYAAIYITN